MYYIAVIIVAVVYIIMYYLGDKIKKTYVLGSFWPALGIFLTFVFNALDKKAVSSNDSLMTMAGLFGLTLYFVILKTAESKKKKIIIINYL